MAGEDAIIDQLHREAAILLRSKKDDPTIISALCAMGATPHYAEQVLLNVKKDVSDKKGFWITLSSGLGLLVMGAILNLASHNFSVAGSHPLYHVFWGVIVAGIGLTARAFIIFRK